MTLRFIGEGLVALVSNLVYGVTSFLNFEYACDRGYAFSERGISAALAQLIHASDMPDSMSFEVPHSAITKAGRGRPKSIDISLARTGTEEVKPPRACLGLGSAAPAVVR